MKKEKDGQMKMAKSSFKQTNSFLLTFVTDKSSARVTLRFKMIYSWDLRVFSFRIIYQCRAMSP